MRWFTVNRKGGTGGGGWGLVICRVTCHYLRLIHRSLPVIRNGADFLTCYFQPRAIQPTFELFEGSTSVLCDVWRPFAPHHVQGKASCLLIHHRSQSCNRPFLPFADNSVSGKVWPRLVTTQWAGMTKFVYTVSPAPFHFPKVGLTRETDKPVHASIVVYLSVAIETS